MWGYCWLWKWWKYLKCWQQYDSHNNYHNVENVGHSILQCSFDIDNFEIVAKVDNNICLKITTTMKTLKVNLVTNLPTGHHQTLQLPLPGISSSRLSYSYFFSCFFVIIFLFVLITRPDLKFVKKFTRPNFRAKEFYTLKTRKLRLFLPAINSKNASLSLIWPSFD